MNVSIGPRWESFVEAVVADGRYESADAIMLQGLKLVEERDRKMKALRETIQDAIALGGSHSVEEVMDHLDDVIARRAAAR